MSNNRKSRSANNSSTNEIAASNRSLAVVIDPGHGGSTTVGGSSWNNATSSSGVLEKTMTLEMAKRIKSALATLGVSKCTLTRTTDVNLGLSARANVARDKGAALFLSLHFNGFNGSARGVETWIRSEDHGNYNYNQDKKFAKKIQTAAYTVIKNIDSGTRNRGVKAKRLGVMSDPQLGNSPQHAPCLACLLEFEFIDVPKVDDLFNGSGSVARKKEIALAIAQAIKDQLDDMA